MLQLFDKALENLPVQVVANGHTNMHFTGADKIDHNTELIKRAKDASQETVADTLPVRVHVQHKDVLLDSDSGREALALVVVRDRLEIMQRLERRGLWDSVRVRLAGYICVGVRMDDGAPTARVLHILDTDGNLAPDSLLHRKRVYDLAAVVRQFCCFVGRDDR